MEIAAFALYVSFFLCFCGEGGGGWVGELIFLDVVLCCVLFCFFVGFPFFIFLGGGDGGGVGGVDLYSCFQCSWGDL